MIATVNDPIDRILSVLEGVRETANGWEACCPAHADSTPSLSVSKNTNGDALFHCKALCTQDEVIRALELRGVKRSELFAHRSANGAGPTKKTWDETWDFVCNYIYTNADGTRRSKKTRWKAKGEDTEKRKKTFTQAYWDENGKLIRKQHPEPVLYNLHLLTKYPDAKVVIVEGEKDVENAMLALRKEKFSESEVVFTTAPGGAKEEWWPAYTESLRGRKSLAVIADRDKPKNGRIVGFERAIDTANHVAPVVDNLRLVTDFPKVEGADNSSVKDTSDYLAIGGKMADLLKHIGQQPRYTPPTNAVETPPADSTRNGTAAPISLNEFDWERPEGQTDGALAARFTKLHGDRVRYCGDLDKFFVFDGRRWAKDSTAHAEDLAKDVAPQFWNLLASGGRAHSDENRRTLVRLGTYAASTRGIRSFLSYARSDRSIATTSAAFDNHPFLFNALNCTIDLETGKARPHDSRDMLTAIAPTPYDPSAQAPVWEATLHSVFDSEELIRFIQRYMGYSLSASVKEQALLIAYGGGSNGKGTILEAFMHAIGSDYAMVGAKNLLMKKNNDAHPTEIADLKGKRFVVCNETDQAKSFDESLIKWLTGGDRVRARKCHENNVEFAATFKIVLATNYRPAIRGQDFGIWRRIALVPFNKQFWDPGKGQAGRPELRADKNLPDRLKAEAPGILAWAVRGCLKWLKNGLQMPGDVRKATESYREDEGLLGAFIAEGCQLGDGNRSRANTLYTSFSAWCQRDGREPGGSRQFYENLSQKGFEKHKSNGIWYLGISVNLSHLATPKEKPLNTGDTTIDVTNPE
jgi:putative DNA primase/helicase